MPKSMFRIVLTVLFCSALVFASALVTAPASGQSTSAPAPTTQPSTAPATGPATTQAVEVPSPAANGGRELAAIYSTLAQSALRGGQVLPAHFKQSAALLRAAMILDPTESRYPRLLHQAMLQLGDSEGAYEALRAYRALEPEDQLAMVEFIDLKTRLIETAAERLDFLSGLLDSAAPVEVKSHAAMKASQVARERGEDALEEKYLAQSIKLNPLNLEALRRRLELLSEEGTPVERLSVMLQMVKSNPFQPEVLYQIARDLADAGLAEESCQYYLVGIKVDRYLKSPMFFENEADRERRENQDLRDAWFNYAAEVFQIGQAHLMGAVIERTDSFLKTDPGDLEAMVLRWLVLRFVDDKNGIVKLEPAIMQAALNRVLTLRLKLEIADTPATRPTDDITPVEIPNFSNDPARFAEAKYAELKMPYAQALADLAWYLSYIDSRDGRAAEVAKILPALRTMLGEKSPTVVRLEGCLHLLQKDPQKAMVSFESASAEDPLAKMSLILLKAKDPGLKSQAVVEAAGLLAQNSSGLVGAILADAFRPLGVKLALREDAGAIRESLTQLSKEWLRFMDNPRAFYSLRAGMADERVSYPYGEPMVAKINIRNVGPFPITIGDEGVIRRDLWFDVLVRGAAQQRIFGITYERLGGVLVLQPGQAVTQTVRIDTGNFSDLLRRTSRLLLTFQLTVRTNPRGEGGAGLGGANSLFDRLTERTVVSFAADPQAIRNLAQQVGEGTPAEKIRGIEMLAAESMFIREMAQRNANIPMNYVAAINGAIERSTSDKNPNVRAWGTFLLSLYEPRRHAALREKLLERPEPEYRILGLMLMTLSSPEDQIKLLERVVTADKSDITGLYAAATLQLAEIARDKAKAGGGTGSATAPSPAPEPAPSTLPAGAGGGSPEGTPKP